MYNLFVLLIVVSLVIAFFFYMERESKRRDRTEKERFREFVAAVKSQSLEEFVQYIPEEGDLPLESDDELIDLDQVDPKDLLRAIKQHEDNKN